jgi:hypothetical protein
VFASGKSPVKVQLRILDTFLGELCVVYTENNETNYVPTTSVNCGVKPEKARLKHIKPMRNV